ncbi:MAG TPA: LysM domain-containing protein [Anaerolineae bacterium]|nr:LysM domain-containing protein [Anaerolineae bacterium]
MSSNPDQPSNNAEWLKFGGLVTVMITVVLVVAQVRPLIFGHIIPAVLGSNLPAETETTDPSSPPVPDFTEQPTPDNATPDDATPDDTTPDDATTPDDTATDEPAPENRVHVVRAGQSLSLIAQTYGVPMQAIMELNNIQNPNSIQAGTELLIPPAQ